MTRHSIRRSALFGAVLSFSVLGCNDSKTVGTIENTGGTSAVTNNNGTGGALASGGATAGGPSTSGIGGVATGGAPAGTGGATAGTGGTDSRCGADAGGLLPAPVLDPTGTYAGKTYAEWGAAWAKWLIELPGPDFPVNDFTGALCAMGQSDGDDGGAGANNIFFLANNWSLAGSSHVTRSCTIPAGQMIFFPIVQWEADNGGVPAASQQTDEQLQGDCSATAAIISAIDLEIDGKSYGSTVCDFAHYLTVWTQFSYTVPNTPTNICNTLPVGCPGWSGSVPKSFVGGYYIMLAPLSAGLHTLHFAASPLCASNCIPTDVTYNLTVE